ncbi:glycosyl transferase family 2 [Opitutaceae bacterium EW11]|nr:glycosyl transferase family 2 [Opitutaceae bacterium EW11]
MPEPKVSVLIPTYNYARFLPEAIESVLVQRGVEFEILISDDASTDGSDRLIRRYASEDKRIRNLQRTRNLGMVANWNACLSEARGEYIKFVFGDDCLATPDALARWCEMLDEHPEASLAASARYVINGRSELREVWDEWRKPGEFAGHDVIARCLSLDKNLIGEPTAVMFRRIQAARGFDENLRQIVDLEMWFHLLHHGTMVYDRTPLCAFRVHVGQQTALNRATAIGAAESLRLTARHLPRLSESRLGWGRRKRILFRTLHYSRKRSPRTPEILAAEARIASQLSRPARAACWALHRISRPFQNLARWGVRTFSPALATPSVEWCPPRHARFSSAAPFVYDRAHGH